MGKVHIKEKTQRFIAAGLWLALATLWAIFCLGQLADAARWERLSLAGRLLSVCQDQEEALLEAVLGEASAADYADGLALLEKSPYASIGFRALGRTEASRLLLLGLGGLAALGLFFFLMAERRERRRLREARALGDSLFLWKPQTPEDARQEGARPEDPFPEVSFPELLYLRDCLARYREQQKREQSAQQKDLEKQTRYLQNISHQIKTPLAGISLCHDYLEATETSPQKRELLRQSRVQINHIEALIRELLLLARLDAGKAVMKLERVPLGQLLERVQQMIHGLAADREAAVFWDYPEDLSVLCDRFWIQEVLLNLLKNALEHIPAGGRIRVWAEAVSDGVDLHIRDNGPGIPKAEQAKIFRRFSSEPSRTDGRNAGIGLNLAYKIILKHGGQLELMDHPGEGAWFRLRLYG